MLAVQPSSKSQKCTPHLLPARLNHNGPINSTQQYWTPTKASDGTSHAYFRGRHLHGTPLPLPDNYTGAVLHVTDKHLPQTQTQTDREAVDVDEEAEKVEVKIVEQVGSFEEVVIWGHGGEVDASQDCYVRGLGEWIGFAESMHGDGVVGKDGEKTKS